MRRSAAPSQLLGNAVKKPRFVPPGTSTFCPVAESKPLSPKPDLGNALEKVNSSKHFTYSVISQCSFNTQYYFKPFQSLNDLFSSTHGAAPEKSTSTSSQ